MSPSPFGIQHPHRPQGAFRLGISRDVIFRPVEAKILGCIFRFTNHQERLTRGHIYTRMWRGATEGPTMAHRHTESSVDSTSPEDGSNFRRSLQIDMKGLVGSAVGNVGVTVAKSCAKKWLIDFSLRWA